MRDARLLESALARPMQLLNYGKPDYFDLAACYAYGLVKNHPFLDGNKRVGFAVSIIFLRANGYRAIATETDAILQTLALARRTERDRLRRLVKKSHSQKPAGQMISRIHVEKTGMCLHLVCVWELTEDGVVADGLEEGHGHAEEGVDEAGGMADV